MKKNVIRSLVFVLSASVGSVMAAETAWYHPAANFQAVLAKNARSLKLGQSQESPASVLTGIPVTGEDYSEINPGAVVFVVNSQNNRVGAEYKSCTNAGDNGERCVNILFAFSGLRYDESSHRIYWGGSVVASKGFWGDMNVEKGFTLSYRVVNVPHDDGYNQWTTYKVVVTLSKI